MKKSKIIIKPATSKLTKEFYGIFPKSFKGIVALLNGKVIGVGGLKYEDGKMMLFSDIKDELRPYKKDICKAIRIFGRMVKKANYPIVAIAGKEEKNSERILTALGFSPNGQLAPEGKIFWRIP